jgi:Otopetrin
MKCARDCLAMLRPGHDIITAPFTCVLEQSVIKSEMKYIYPASEKHLHLTVFGVGSMIYSGLEFAQFFEVDITNHCNDILNAITPAARMAFTFIQMYFIFLNAKVSVVASTVSPVPLSFLMF